MIKSYGDFIKEIRLKNDKNYENFLVTRPLWPDFEHTKFDTPIFCKKHYSHYEILNH